MNPYKFKKEKIYVISFEANINSEEISDLICNLFDVHKDNMCYDDYRIITKNNVIKIEYGKCIIRSIFGWGKESLREVAKIYNAVLFFHPILSKEIREGEINLLKEELKTIQVPIELGLDINFVTQELFNIFKDKMILPYPLLSSDRWKGNESSEYIKINVNKVHVCVNSSGGHGLLITACAAMDSHHLFIINPPPQISYTRPLVQATFVIHVSDAALVSYRIVRN